MRLWCEHAWLGGARAEAHVAIDVADGVIRAVQPAASSTGRERLDGLTVPGLANAHSHAFQRVLRARAQRGRGSFWTWREAMYEAAASLSPDDLRRLATAVFAEMALAGVTLVGEFHYLHHGPDGRPYEDPNAMGHAVVDAAAAAGVRLTLLDTCYLRGGFDDPELSGAQRRFGDGSVDSWAHRVGALAPSPTTRIGAAAHSVRALSEADLAAVAAWARDHEVPLHAHVSEQPQENAECLRVTGRTPVRLMADAGLLDADFTAVHATHLSASDAALLQASTWCLCPTTERDLADGIGRPPLGARLALGSDSNAVIDLLEETRAVELDERLATGVRVHREPDELLRATTAGGYAALGWDGGTLRPGAPADLTVLRLDSVRLAGTPPEHLLDAAVFAAHPADVDHVMVDGDWVVRDGRHMRVDVGAELGRALR